MQLQVCLHGLHLRPLPPPHAPRPAHAPSPLLQVHRSPSTRLPVLHAAPNFEADTAPRRSLRRQPKSRPGTAAGGQGQGKQQQGGTKNAATEGKTDSSPARLAKVLAAAGVASRRACEDLIDRGVVAVNGKVVQEQGTLVRPGVDKVTVDGRPVATGHIGEKLYYFAVNKPKGYICSNSAINKEGKRAIDLLEPWLEGWRKDNANKGLLPPRLFTVGRLDVASTGLIFITNDGHWAQKVIHPSSNLTKEYLVLVDRPASKAQVTAMMSGVEIDGAHIMPEEISTLEDSLRLRIVVKEGKKHESGGSSQLYNLEEGPAAGMPEQQQKHRHHYHLQQQHQHHHLQHLQLQQEHRHQQHEQEQEYQQGQQQQQLGVGPHHQSQIKDSPLTPQPPPHPTSPTGTHAHFVPLATDHITPHPLPAFSSSRLILHTPDQPPMWIWNVAVWRLSRALADRDRITRALPVRQRYRGGVPLRRRKLRRWWEQPLVVQPPVPPNLWEPGEWADLERADLAREAAREGWRLQEARREKLGEQQREQAGQREQHEYQEQEEQIEQTEQQGGVGGLREQARLRRLRTQQQGERRWAVLGRELTSREDWDWEVRILVSSVGLEVLSLKRVRVGGYRIPRSLNFGDYIPLSPTAIKKVTSLKEQEAQTSLVPQKPKYTAKKPIDLVPADLRAMLMRKERQ